MEQDLYEQIIASAHDVYGRHPGHRALHAKGTWCEGEFTASPEAAALSRAFHLRGEPVAAVARFSNASGNPEAHDAERDSRGMAVKLRAAGEECDILATTSPTFITRTPEDFLELMRIRRPDPETGEPDMEKLGAWLGEHPEAQTAAMATVAAEPLASFAAVRYFSPHTFFLLDAEGGRTPVRGRWRPDEDERRIGDDEARARGRDHLHEELAARLADGVVGFTLEFVFPEAGDPLDDATALWPDDRRTLDAGRLEVRSVVADPEQGRIDVFDPMRLPDGIEPSDDPILHARPRAYSVSAHARLEARDG